LAIHFPHDFAATKIDRCVEGRRVRLNRQRTVDVVAGDGFDVTLADLPGAGYIWTPAEIPAGLTLVETRQEVPATDALGSAQNKILRFQADQAGDYEIVFTFARPWEDSPAETQTIRVRVRPPDSQGLS
jgi:inhibitor of cysteine peptidase